MGCALRHRVDYCSLHLELAQLSYFGINNWISSPETKITDCQIKICPNTKSKDYVLHSVSLHYFKAMICIVLPDLNLCLAARTNVLEFQQRSNLILRKTIPMTSLFRTSNLTHLLPHFSPTTMWSWICYFYYEFTYIRF
jgi:hypothetical protein